MKFYFPGYLALVCVALVIAAIVWEVIAPGHWFYCADSVGFSFFPPFAHTDVATYGHTEDRYLVAPTFVYSVWGGMVAAAVVLPAVIILIGSRLLRSFRAR